MMWKIAAIGFALVLSACSTSDVTGSRGVSPVQAYSANTAQQPVAAAIVNAMAGGLIGGPLGSKLDRSERRRALEAEYRALEYTPAGKAVAWGTSAKLNGQVMAGSPYRVGSQNCRQYTHTVNAGGQAQTARGSACRNPDGSWTPLV